MPNGGLIGAELHAAPVQTIATRRAGAERRPPLDLPPPRIELVQQLPIFACLDE